MGEQCNHSNNGERKNEFSTRDEKVSSFILRQHHSDHLPNTPGVLLPFFFMRAYHFSQPKFLILSGKKNN